MLRMPDVARLPQKSMNSRPKLDIPFSSFEYTLNIAAALGLLFDAYLLWRFWPILPERLPTHYNFAGRPDAWGGKETLVTLPVLSLFLFLMFIILERFPRIYNYPFAITEVNAGRQYKLARTFLAWLNFAIIWFFAYTEWRTIGVAVGQFTGSGSEAAFVFLVMIFGSMAIYIYQAYKAK